MSTILLGHWWQHIGIDYADAFVAYEAQTAALIRGNVQLDERKLRRCGRCDGIGSLVVRRRVVDCEGCGGKGVVIG